MAKLRVDDAEASWKLISIAAQKVARLEGEQVTNLLWAIGQLKVQRVDLAPFIARFGAILSGANAHSCSTFIYSCHGLGWSSEQDYRAVLQHFVTLNSDTPQQYANIIWALSFRLEEAPPEVGPLFDGFVKCLQDAKPQEISNVLIGL